MYQVVVVQDGRAFHGGVIFPVAGVNGTRVIPVPFGDKVALEVDGLTAFVPQDLGSIGIDLKSTRIGWAEQLRSEALRKSYAAKIALEGVGEVVSDIYSRFPESRRPASEKQIDYADIRNAIRKINYADSRFNEKYRTVVDDAVKDALKRKIWRFERVVDNTLDVVEQLLCRLEESPLEAHHEHTRALSAIIDAQVALLDTIKLLDEAQRHLSQS